MNSKSLDDSLFLAKRSINDLFRDLLEENRGFKYILSTRVTLKKWNNATNAYDIDTIFRNSDPITVINKRFDLGIAYETLKHRLSIYSDGGSGWIIDKIEDIWITVANYEPLPGSSYFPLPIELRNSMKGLINLKNKDTKCFKWCHIKFMNPQNSHPERINNQGKKIESTLDYRGINFPMKARDYEIIEERFNINVNVFRYGDKIFPLYVSKKFNEQVFNVLLVSNEEKSHYVLMKDFNRYDIECLLKRIDVSLGKHTKIYQKHIPNSIGAKLVCIDIEFTLPTKLLLAVITLKHFLNGFLNKKNKLMK